MLVSDRLRARPTTIYDKSAHLVQHALRYHPQQFSSIVAFSHAIEIVGLSMQPRIVSKLARKKGYDVYTVRPEQHNQSLSSRIE